MHIGVLSIRLVLQSFCRPRRPGKKHAVTVNAVSLFYKFLLVRSIIVKSRSFGTLYSHGQRWRHFKTLWCDGTDCDVIKRMVGITGDPQAVEKNSKFPGYGYDGSFLAIFPPRSNIRVPQRLRSLSGPKRPNRY